MRYRISSCIVLIIALLAGSASAQAASSSILISEIQTGSVDSASQEFVELYNVSNQDVSLSGWKVEYKSASGSSWSVKATLSGTIVSHGYYLLGATGYAISPDITFSAGLSGSGGHLRITNGVDTIDLVGWGTALGAEGTHAASAPAGGQSIERLPGRLNETGGNGIDTDDNAADFVVRSAAQPQSASSGVESPDLTPPVESSEEDVSVPDVVEYLPLMITELLIDPASPKLDSQHEFIEIYNPNDEPVNLSGYTLRAGTNFRDYYILPSQTLGSGEYIVFYSGITHLALTNSGGVAQLLDPAGTVVSQTQVYDKAATGRAWGLFGGNWKWTAALTPAAENILDEPVPTATKTTKVTSAKSPAKKTAAKAPKSTAKSKAAKKATTPKPKAAKSAFANVSNVVAQPSTGFWLIIGLATLTIGYAIYEYRQDLQNRIYLARRKFKAWLANRTRP